ncbi:MAG TPA: hypothetical protein VF444_18465 [Pseudonocardiaceae bacterium]
MDDLTREICLRLKQMNQTAGAFVAGMLSDDLSREDQIAFAHRLVDLAEAVRDRALETPVIVDATTRQ